MNEQRGIFCKVESKIVFHDKTPKDCVLKPTTRVTMLVLLSFHGLLWLYL
jgi:hypothetical protein